MSDRVRDELVARIMGPLTRRLSTATVLFHHAIAERLGLGPSDHKCLDLLLERGPMTGSQLAAITGLTTGAVTGVVSRLERAGYVRRDPDPTDRRKQLLTVRPEALRTVQRVFDGIPAAPGDLLDGFDDEQVAAIATFLERAVDYAYERAAALRAGTLAAGGRPAVSAWQPAAPDRAAAGTTAPEAAMTGTTAPGTTAPGAAMPGAATADAATASTATATGRARGTTGNTRGGNTQGRNP